MYYYFKGRFPSELRNGEEVFIFSDDRYFDEKDYIISIHSRNNGRIPTHVYKYIVMTYVYSGTLHISAADDVFDLHAGDIIVMDSHVPHCVETTGDDDLGINIVLRPDFLSKGSITNQSGSQEQLEFIFEMMGENSHMHYFLFQTDGDEHVKNTIDCILCEHFDPNNASRIITEYLIRILFYQLSVHEKYYTNLTARKFKNQQLINLILQYISNNYVSGNLQEACSQLGYDPSYTSKLVKRSTGKTFKQLVNEARMKEAESLLSNPNLPIADVAISVGISNLTAFYKRFVEYKQMTPAQYRAKISDE